MGLASGYALARDRPPFVNLHTAPGLGNAVNAIANARDSRVLASKPLERAAGEEGLGWNLPAVLLSCNDHQRDPGEQAVAVIVRDSAPPTWTSDST